MQKQFHLAAVYDTETSNIGTTDKPVSIPIAYIFNDIRYVSLRTYEPGASKYERITIVRTELEALDYLRDLITWGQRATVIPIVCAYNLMFDLQSLLHRLSNEYELSAIAQSSTNAYVVDLKDGDDILLRFWDTFHLEMNGLAAMGDTCGFEKATGDWDYDLVRTPDTPLTDLELGYATRDVQVIPAYLRYLLEANEWLTPAMLGSRVLTKTSLVRQMAKAEVGKQRISSKANSFTLHKLMAMRCVQEMAPTYAQYALRKACFRGGFTFTAAAAASKVVRNVHSIDVTSMHHTYINGRRIPINWFVATSDQLEAVCSKICSKNIDDVLRRYDYPFRVFMHARIRLTNIRLKPGTAFSTWHIGLLAQSKFGSVMPTPMDYEPNVLNEAAEATTRASGWHDSAVGAVFAFGKLYSAAQIVVHVSEVELWNMSRVYTWDTIEPVFGELAQNSTLPPDYVTLQSNILYERKDAAKQINNNYKEGIAYYKPIPDSIPPGIAAQLKQGTLSNDFISAWYATTVKGSFNGVYGTMAMDILRPDFMFDETGDMLVDMDTRVSAENYDEKLPSKNMVLYTYGLRIVAGSRQHLVIALELLYQAFGKRILVTGGDTDSLKVCTPKSIKPADLLAALKPLEDAIDAAIDTTMARVRRLYPKYASKLQGVGHFDYEGTEDWHLEAWNKARVSVTNGKAHITCAGLMRPHGQYHIGNWIEDSLAAGHSPSEVLPWVLGYRGTVTHDICHALEHTRPVPSTIYDGDVEDYMGNKTHVRAHECIALWPSARELGGMTKQSNIQNVAYLENVLHKKPEQREHVITLDNKGKPALYVHLDNGEDLTRIW